VSEFNNLRSLAGRELWEKILLDVEATKSAVVQIRENRDVVAAEIGYDAAFLSQCAKYRKQTQ
jgi:hypothetical protein